MQDPVRTFESIRDFYITYLETAFRIGEPVIQARRRELLERVETLATEPYIEPLPRYTDSNVRLEDLNHPTPGGEWLPGFSEAERRAFVSLCLGGLIPAKSDDHSRAQFSLYTHQLDMLRRGIRPGTPGIVTSGTGSGKTESFLLPVLAAISREATRWPASPQLRSWRPWWLSDTETPTFMRDDPWEASGRPKAMRALVLYPMNALVEDQMVRLRKALDSGSAHKAMADHFGGNGIFYGRYTGATKVTGWLHHPRVHTQQERDRAQRRVEELREYMRGLLETENAALALSKRNGDKSLPFNFPRAMGNEVVSRWDMQRHPPDILITNTSMLSTMLVREIDEPIFRSTREWIETDPDAYFYLILDELHLQRGSAGTEIAYMLRAVLDALGLTAPAHRNKVRILCSSASLPVDGPLREQSLDYLWGFFGTVGLPANGTRQQWSEAIVQGSSPPVKPPDFSGDVQTLCSSISSLRNVEANVVSRQADIWSAIAKEVGVNDPQLSGADLAWTVVNRAGHLLEEACASNGTTRATSVTGIAHALFGTHVRARDAAHDLVWLRSCSDLWKPWFGKPYPDSPSTPRFRIHTFIRAIEGLFAAPRPAPVSLPTSERAALLFGDLSVESGIRYGDVFDGRRSRRIDLLYCECCGVLFFGGKKGGGDVNRIELLPNDPDTESLPERAKVNQVEQRTGEDYALFMPTVSRFWPIGNEQPADDDAQGRWEEAEYDPFSATITKRPPVFSESHRIPGWRYHVDLDPARFRGEARRKQQSSSDPGSALPFQCPACATSYRKARGKLSPLRGFRVGFAKTTQLLASSLMAELQLSNPTERLVSFSDSRQDAAKAAFDLEGGHHDDVRRELVVRALQERRSAIGARPEIDNQLRALQARQRELVLKDERTSEEEDEYDQLNKRISELTARRRLASQDCVAVRDVVEPREPQPGAPLRPVLAGLVGAGIHPIDRTGVMTVPEASTGRVTFAWQQLFTSKDDRWAWVNPPSRVDDFMAAFREIGRELLDLVGSTIFSKTYFALEESGWGYACLPLRDGVTREQLAKYDAAMRVLADANRIDPSTYSDNIAPWATKEDALRNRRLRAFLQAVHRETGEDPNELADSLLTEMQRAGHVGGMISIADLSYLPLEDSASFWRCDNCGRVHLHLGAHVCTRCGARLAHEPTGQVSTLRKANFLGKRIIQSRGIRRLRAEELTGMTTNPAARLRRFKGILINDDDDILPLGYDGLKPEPELDARARVVDVLSVTTTMEVGVDIGDLRSVFQANMPPQRFNYQQRVGRAGRRGQAFSFVLTVCRSKSHDLHYFRHPAQITGDPPPPPFLTTSLNQIAHRLIFKVWLVAAFRNLRMKAGRRWLGDELRGSPDTHGEFFRVASLTQARSTWMPRIREELESCKDVRNKFAMLCFQGDQQRVRQQLALLEVDDALKHIEVVLNDRSMQPRGLAEGLAEHGFFPMYGMPTRIRVLHTRPIRVLHGLDFATMDRDLDVAIQEFAPGKVLVQDKRRYFTAGFSGDSLKRSWNNQQSFTSTPDDLGELRYLAECSVCQAWSRTDDPSSADGQCRACGSEKSGSRVYTTYAPHGFITSLIARKADETGDEIQTRASKSSVAEAESTEVHLLDAANVRLGVSSQSQVYRLNRGAYRDGNWTGWNAEQGDLRVPYKGSGPSTTLYVNGVWLDSEAVRIDTGAPALQQRFAPNGNSAVNFYLAAPKVTDSLVLVPDSVPRELELVSASSTGERLLTPGFRAGALSALFLIVNHASREILDVDPDEFEILEPRVQSLGAGRFVPLMQIADELVNGSGLTNRLTQKGASGAPIVLEVIRHIVSSVNASPLRELRAPDHASACFTGCYRCLHRYGNQSYHGLLDWRLGLDVLELLCSKVYLAGIDGRFNSPGVNDWLELARSLAAEAAGLFNTEVSEKGGLPVFGIGPRRWAAVIHPFWSREHVTGFRPELDEFGLENRLEFVSSFELARRMGEVLSRLRAG